MSDKFVAYYRVSTSRQGASGLGMEAQRNAALVFVSARSGMMVSEFTEIESGKKNNREMLRQAIDLCQMKKATLIIAKLDRLARNVAFIANLLESGVKFVAADMPNADRFILHVYAAMAEEEARRISERTKAALASARRRGVVLGSHGRVLAEKNKRSAEQFSAEIGPQIEMLLNKERLSFRGAADMLNSRGIQTVRGGQWHATSVHRVWRRFLATTPKEEKEASGGARGASLYYPIKKCEI